RQPRLIDLSFGRPAQAPNGEQVVRPFRYPLTIRRPFAILPSDSGWRGPNAIRSVETARVHHAARRRGGVAARGAGAAVHNAGDRVSRVWLVRYVRALSGRVPERP